VNKLRVLIVDDEELARLRLRGLLADCTLPGAEVVGEASSAAEALHKLASLDVDVVLLDIQMPGPDGMALAARLRSQPRRPLVVFVTAHAGHALQAFDIDAADYLTKPVRRARLQEALVRVTQRLGLSPAGAAAAAAPASDGAGGGGGGAAEQPVLVVSDRGRMQRVPVSDILYLKAELKYVTLRTAAHAYVLDDSLSDLEQRLGDVMLRVHRNALVARSAVIRLERHCPTAGDGPPGEADSEGWAVQVEPTHEWLAVSRRQLAMVRELLASDGV
jgi:two-component system response regulator AlgR